MGNSTVKYPKQHPILRNMFACLMTIIFVLPLLVTLIGFGVKKVNDRENIKTETTVGEILHYYVDTDRNGNANYYNTEVSYVIDDITYSKSIRTRYYVADKGAKVVLYYAKGNPFSVVFTVQEYDFGLDMKLKTFLSLTYLTIALFIYKAYTDSSRYQNMITMAQCNNAGISSGFNNQYNNINQSNFGGNMNNGNNNNMF